MRRFARLSVERRVLVGAIALVAGCGGPSSVTTAPNRDAAADSASSADVASGMGGTGTVGATGVAGTGVAGATGAAGTMGVAGTGAAGATGAAGVGAGAAGTGAAGTDVPVGPCTGSADCKSWCAGARQVSAGICDKNTCSYPSAEDCGGGFVCSTGACKTQCASDADCVSARFCRTGACVVDAVAITSQEGHTCALVADGSVVCWGGGFGTAGMAPSLTHPPQLVAGLSNATAVGVGQVFGCALRKDGSVWCWGGNYKGQLGNGMLLDMPTPAPVMKLGHATAIAVGIAHSCAVVDGGKVACWGNDMSGQLGSGGPADSPLPLLVPGLTDATDVSAGLTFSCALRAGGNVVCWGANYSGQLGNGTRDETLGLVTVKNLSGVKRIVSSGGSGRDFSCALLADDTIRCWGDNSTGQLGLGVEPNPYSPATPHNLGGQRFTSIALGTGVACAVRAGGAVTCWGWGGAFGRAMEVPEPVDVPVLTGVTALAPGEATMCALLADGGVVCMGAGKYDQLGNGVLKDSAVPVPVLGW